MQESDKRVVVIGSSISGGIASCYLKLRFPDFDVVSIQKQHAKFPVVGESLTEFSTLMLHEIGLGSYLEERHYHKFGLTFYFKEDLDDPTDSVYAVHEAPRIPPMPSNQINRFALAERLRERAAELGVTRLDGTATGVSIDKAGRNTVTFVPAEGEPVPIHARWIVDASGRSRFLASRLGLKQPARLQRSSFWFRLEDFDKSILAEMKQVKALHHCFDSYYVTHHFFGRNNWIWAIPMRPDRAGCKNLISIGIVYRPELYGGEVLSLDDFLSNVEAEHPVIAKLVRSGTIADTNIFRNYFYETERSYSPDGWFIIGDAGDTVDPLYSTGIAMTSIQIKQAAAIIAAEMNGTLSERFTRDLETLYKAIRHALQHEIGTLYEVMHDPYQAHLRMHCASAFYFYVLLPAYLNGYITDRVGAPLLSRIIEESAGSFESLRSLLAVASRKQGRLPASEIKNLYDKTVNWQLSGASEEMMPRYLAQCSLLAAQVRFSALRKSGWHKWPTHLSICAADLLKVALFGGMMRSRPVRASRFLKWMLARPRSARMGSAKYRMQWRRGEVGAQ